MGSFFITLFLIIFGMILYMITCYINNHNRYIFHKYKIIEETHNNDKVDYTVKRNGFLWMPFLYRIDKINKYSFKYVKGWTLNEAKLYVENKLNEYNNYIGKKVKSTKIINLD